MKTTLEIPDAIFRRAKARAAQRGIPLRQFVTAAVEEKLKDRRARSRTPWMKHAGKLKRWREESRRIDRAIEETFEAIDREAWASVPPE